ncbi:hypothetical protein FRB90_002097 [Tulasnella sp. 427]|nr:hypothetical protein FRB90_002097 [Tulasnella sp. 427]
MVPTPMRHHPSEMTTLTPSDAAYDDEILYEDFQKLSNLPLPPVVEHEALPASITMGSPGGHRCHELTSTGKSGNHDVVVPARQSLMTAIISNITALDSTDPNAIKDDTTPTIQSILQRLSSGNAAYSTENLPEPLVSSQLHPAHPIAQSFCPMAAKLKAFGTFGRWDMLAQSPPGRTLSWGQMLSLIVYPGAYLWTRIPALASYHRPRIVNVLDHSAAGFREAMDTSLVVPASTAPFFSTRLLFHPFATRFHTTKSAQFRWQCSGYCLVYALLWDNWTSVTPAQRQYRTKKLQGFEWAQSRHGPPHTQGPRPSSSRWVRHLCKPSDVLYWPPGTFVIEYSLGLSMSTEGDFLPWPCLPLVQKISSYPPTYVLLAMALLSMQDLKYGRADNSELSALHDLISSAPQLKWPPGTEPWNSKIKEFVDRANKAVKAIANLRKKSK